MLFETQLIVYRLLQPAICLTSRHKRAVCLPSVLFLFSWISPSNSCLLIYPPIGIAMATIKFSASREHFLPQYWVRLQQVILTMLCRLSQRKSDISVIFMHRECADLWSRWNDLFKWSCKEVCGNFCFEFCVKTLDMTKEQLLRILPTGGHVRTQPEQVNIPLEILIFTA